MTPRPSTAGPPALSVGDAIAQAIALHRAGRLGEAERVYRAVLTSAPRQFDALHLLGVLAVQRDRLEEGARLIGEALAVRPDAQQALANLANALQRLGRHEEAIAACDRALVHKPDDPEVHNTRGLALANLGRHEEALESYGRALACDPRHAAALANRGFALNSLRRYAEALEDLDRALASDPGNANAHASRGHALGGLSRHEDAIAAFTRALAIEPDRVNALATRGFTLHYLGRNDDAAKDFARAVAIDPACNVARNMLAHIALHNCEWGARDAVVAALTKNVRAGTGDVEPFVFLVQSDSAADQLACAKAAVREKIPPAARPLWNGERYAHERLRIAYLSADFREHATAYLIADLIERHDRARFEVAGLSWSADARSPISTRVAKAFERFVDIRTWTDAETAQWLRTHEFDIVVDLMGFTNGMRTNICAQRAAPVQVNFLGYPGTLGTTYFDYIVADATVIPASDRMHYSESVAYLPDAYQPNDRWRPIAELTPSRAQCGLPERGFVFCAFNNLYKITPAMFDVWMRLLAGVDGSVLWLLAGSAVATENLRREARARDIDPARLVFAPRLPLAEHLARQRVADLFLDTLPCNAHTTASDALWAGLPLVTCLGHSFAGRVAGSLVRAAGLPDLVTSSLAEYEALAFRLATRPEALAEVRARLARQRLTCALFDSEPYCRNLEAAFAHMVERSRLGLPPASFAVAAGAPPAIVAVS